MIIHMYVILTYDSNQFMFSSNIYLGKWKYGKFPCGPWDMHEVTYFHNNNPAQVDVFLNVYDTNMISFI